MNTTNTYTVGPGWRVFLTDLGLNPANVLKRAGLPGDLFGRQRAALYTDEYFRMWDAIADELGEPPLPQRVAQALAVEAFDPPLFAAMCSPDLNTALDRIAHYKRLMAPMALHLKQTDAATRLEVAWLDQTRTPPSLLIAMELVFFTQLARIGTRSNVIPREVEAPIALEPERDYRAFFGVRAKRGASVAVVFARSDAVRPFLTANETMWTFFEPELQRTLAELDSAATLADRVRSALLELIPAGLASIESVAKRLGTSARTLQRKLKREGSNFQSTLNDVRKELAMHYLKSSQMSGAEISFLLGFDDPNSFFRAFRNWTGGTPAQTRLALQ